MKIVILNLSETTRDPRVRRIAEALANKKHKVTVYNLNSENKSSEEEFMNFTIKRIPPCSQYAVEDIAALYRANPLFEKILQTCGVKDFYQKKNGGAFSFFKNTAKLKEQIDLPSARSIFAINGDFYRKIIKRENPDVIHCNDLDTLVAGYLLKKYFDIPLLYDAHEIYPEQFAKNKVSQNWHKFHVNLEKYLLPFTDQRMTVCDSLARFFEKEYGSKPFTTIKNVVSLRHLPPEEILRRKNQPVKILYHGMYLPYRGLEEIIEAAPLIKNAEIYFRGIGNHENSLKAFNMEKGGRAHFLPSVKVNELVETASGFDIGINPFISVCKNTEFALPNKFFEYMMAGLAIASSRLTELKKITEELEIGVLFDPLQPESIAEALNKLTLNDDYLASTREKAYFKAKEEYNWEQEVEKLYRLYEYLTH